MTDETREAQLGAVAEVLQTRGLVHPEKAPAIAREILNAADSVLPKKSMDDPYGSALAAISTALGVAMADEHAGKMNELEFRNLQQLALKVADLDPEAAREVFNDDKEGTAT